MYVDALTLAAVTAELQQHLINGRIQRVLLLNPLSIGLEVYANHRRYHLVASAHPQTARLHLVREKLSRGLESETPFYCCSENISLADGSFQSPSRCLNVFFSSV